MTDNQTKSIEKQPQESQVKNSQVKSNQAQTSELKSQNVVSNHSNTQSDAAKPAAKVTSAPEPQVKKVDIAIAGVTYPIYCPVHEEEELRAAVFYINDYVLDLRRNSPSLSQESLLVLCCLNLYEKIQTNKRDEEDRLQQDKQSVALLNKVIQDAHSIL
ncbi:cell division protein ZapA [Psychrobacter sp. DAB_AL62B]|uniref:cell division protein ZapA n=1 Tax=Psychrobacter sp. DAB_AL62B TaxID=1028420 RepID=UPI002380E818|nr:cell division protein ZapA [Psychrobacter sp. DAB_AL62B]MDE4455438.1 cell division protein ZapA [Psychrobacter sp. DAB_AL62B]